MSEKESCHSICRWTFHSGKGGFVPSDSIPQWSSDKLDSKGVIRIVKEKIAPRIPEQVTLGLEFHYDFEVDESNAHEVEDALIDSGIYLAVITPGAHKYFAYGGLSSLDPEERKKAKEFLIRSIDFSYEYLRKAWHPNQEKHPTFVIWNGSFGYDIASAGIKNMYEILMEEMAEVCEYEQKKGGKLFIAIEPKPNEGHPAMLLPTVPSAILFWKKLHEEYGISLSRKGVNKEIGHSEMIGLDYVHDTVEEIENGMLVHMHINSQGLSDGITLGGPGKFDIDMGARITASNIAMAGLARMAGYERWKGHDMQVRPYDNEEQAIERIIRSILSWEALRLAEKELDYDLLIRYLTERDTAKAEDLIRDVIILAHKNFKRLYEG